MAERLAMPKSWHVESKPHKFCPGCGHGIVLKILGEVIDELEIQDRMVFGVDIGCSLLAWDFFDVDTVQTHHGRTNPVMVGLKRANPELLPIAYMGDGGGYAIGSQHLVNSTFRNEKVMAIVVNNCNYGMTGGQMSPTSLPGQKTETSPFGRDPKETGNPTLGPEMVAAIASPGAYVARASVSNIKQLKRFMKRAVENQIAGNGFSFLEVLSSCPTNWRTNAKQTWAFIEEDMATYFKTGEFRTPDESKEG